jgi:hypothetical protein
MISASDAILGCRLMISIKSLLRKTKIAELLFDCYFTLSLMTFLLVKSDLNLAFNNEV